MSARAAPACGRLRALQACRDTASLRSAIGELCAEFGKLTRIDIVTMAEAEKRRALCFLRLESQAQETRLMASLGASRFGEDVLVVVELPASAAPGLVLQESTAPSCMSRTLL